MRLVLATLAGFALLVAVAHAGEGHPANHHIVFTAAPGEGNSVHVEYRTDDVDVSDDQPLTAGAGCTEVGATEATCPPAPVRLDLGDRDDEGFVRCDSLCGEATMHGGAGDDNLSGDERHDVLDGGPGDDELFGGVAGADVLRGGPGDDSFSPADGALLFCGSGRDTFLAHGRTTISDDCERFSDNPWGDTDMRVANGTLTLVAHAAACPVDWILGQHNKVVRAIPDRR